MELEFKDKKLQKYCQSEKDLLRKYGKFQAKIILIRLNQLQAAENLYDISRLPQVRLHPLSGDRQGEFAVDLQQPKRLIFIPQNGSLNDYKTITKIQIIEIVNYH